MLKWLSCLPAFPGLFLLVPLAHENMLPGKGERAVLPDADAEIGEEPDGGDSGPGGHVRRGMPVEARGYDGSVLFQPQGVGVLKADLLQIAPAGKRLRGESRPGPHRSVLFQAHGDPARFFHPVSPRSPDSDSDPAHPRSIR